MLTGLVVERMPWCAGLNCPVRQALASLLRRKKDLEALELAMQIEEERADAAALKIERRLRRLQVFKQGDDNDLVEAQRWLQDVASEPGAGDTDRTERATTAREVVDLISRSLLRRCHRGLTLDERRAKLVAREEASELAGDALAASLAAVARDLVNAETAGAYNNCGCGNA